MPLAGKTIKPFVTRFTVYVSKRQNLQKNLKNKQKPKHQACFENKRHIKGRSGDIDNKKNQEQGPGPFFPKTDIPDGDKKEQENDQIGYERADM